MESAIPELWLNHLWQGNMVFNQIAYGLNDP